MAKTQFNRRNFLQTSAIGASALSLSAASAARVYGANEKINIAFLGVGGRCQQHIDVILQMQKENNKALLCKMLLCRSKKGKQKFHKHSFHEHFTKDGSNSKYLY